MESTGGSSNTAASAMPSPPLSSENCKESIKEFNSSLFKATNFEFHPSLTEEEKSFYIKAYPTVDVVRERKTHCTVCKAHIGTAPVQENGIKMHPILRVTHCNKCHDFYNSGEFSKGEDGSELYCRWCGQGGEVYCCSSCPYVFCKSCIVKNLSRGVVADIEQNENWNCFSCAPKILWPLRAQHWALMNYIEHQKKELNGMNLSEAELKLNLSKDRSKCCRLAKAKCGNMSDSMESLDSVASKRSHSSSFSAKKPPKHPSTSPQIGNAAKRAKSNDEVVCTPDLMSMLEPDCQITVPAKPNRPIGSVATVPKVMSIQQPQASYGTMSAMSKSSAPPPLVLRNTAIKLRPAAPPPVVRRTIIGPRTPNPGGNGTPVYHTINGYRIDLNSAAQQDTFRLPNGKLIQVKRQGPPPPTPSVPNWQQMSSPSPQRVIPQTIASRPVQITQHPYNISVQQQPGQHPQVVRYHNNMMGTTTISPVTHNGTTIQVLNGQVNSGTHQQPQQATIQHAPTIRPVMVRNIFPDTPVGHARSGLQDQVFNAMEICTHLTNKIQTLTNSNAYKQARNFLEVKELYIHLSYLLTYAIGRFKSLQDKCLGDMRTLGFGNDADSLENGQLAADKQASDDEDNEIEIVEPKTDLITLDSDDDEPTTTSTPIKLPQVVVQNKSHTSILNPKIPCQIKVKAGTSPIPIAQPTKPTTIHAAPLPVVPQIEDDTMDLMSMAQSFLASMLEVDITEGPALSLGTDGTPKKQPRKKLTNKPNPTLLKQKALLERERLEEMKRNDQKLKMKCAVELEKAEIKFPYAKEMLEAKAKEKMEFEKMENEKINSENETINGFNDEQNEENPAENDQSNKSITEEKESKENTTENITIDDSSEKENLSEIELEKSSTDAKQDEETKSCDDKNKEKEKEEKKEEATEKVNTTDETTPTKEEDDNELIKNVEENSQNKDNENEITNNANDKESMESEQNEAKDEAMDVEEDDPSKENNIEEPQIETKKLEEEETEPETLPNQEEEEEEEKEQEEEKQPEEEQEEEKEPEEEEEEEKEPEEEEEEEKEQEEDKHENNSAMDVEEENNELELDCNKEKNNEDLKLSSMDEEPSVISSNKESIPAPQNEVNEETKTDNSSTLENNTSLEDCKETSSNGNV